MTTQNNATSPFQNKSDNGSSASEDFSIRTMQDDLVSLQKNETLSPGKTNSLPTKESSIELDPQTAPKKEQFTQNLNPFLEQEAKTTLVSSTLEAPLPKEPFKEEKVPIVSVPVPEKNVNDSSSTTYRIVLATIIVLIIAIAGLGGYYFWMTKSSSDVVVVPEPAIVQPTTPSPVVEEPPVIIVAPVEKYSTTKPNYLTLDIATLTADEIKKKLIKVAEELKTATAQSPYEFVVVDANNAPVAFPIFSIASKLNLSSKILSSLGTEFSLFFFNDNGEMRLALSTTITKKDILSKELPIQEKTFVTDAGLLFLAAIPEIKTGAFIETSYNNVVIKYLNVNQPKNLSIDYSTVDNKFLLSASKNTQRAMIDKLTVKAPAVEKIQSPTTGKSQTPTTGVVIPKN